MTSDNNPALDQDSGGHAQRRRYGNKHRIGNVKICYGSPEEL